MTRVDLAIILMFWVGLLAGIGYRDDRITAIFAGVIITAMVVFMALATEMP